MAAISRTQHIPRRMACRPSLWAVLPSVVLAGMLLQAGDALAAKKTYRCESGGRVIYQQTACNVESSSAPPAAASAAKGASSAAMPASGAASRPPKS
jgi:hypothetical protein